MYRGETMAGHIEDEAPNDPSRGFVGGYYMQLLVARRAVHGRVHGPGRAGAATSPRSSSGTSTWPACGSSARTCRRRPTASRSTATCSTSTASRCPTCTSTTTPNDLAMREHAWRAGEALYESVGALRTLAHAALPGDAQHRHGADERAARGRRGQRVRPGARRPEPVRLRRQPVHDGRGREPDARRSSRWRSGRPSTSPRQLRTRRDPDRPRDLERARPGRLGAGGRASAARPRCRREPPLRPHLPAGPRPRGVRALLRGARASSRAGG